MQRIPIEAFKTFNSVSVLGLTIDYGRLVKYFNAAVIRRTIVQDPTPSWMSSTPGIYVTTAIRKDDTRTRYDRSLARCLSNY